MSIHPECIRAEYRDLIEAVRQRFGDDHIVDIFERHLHGVHRRDEVMELLDIDYVGTFYEMLGAYDLDRPGPDRVEGARQEEMMRLIFEGREVPENLRQPASWRQQRN